MDTYDDTAAAKRYEANQLFNEAYEAQLAHDYERAIELYKRSIETYPTAEAHTYLGWVYSFQNRYDEAIEECLEAIRVDETLGNPYNDIGSYILRRAILTDRCAGSSARCWRRDMSRMRFRISISGGFMKHGAGFSRRQDITVWRSSRSLISRKPRSP
jgi:tetratricopeptide (TPR) repeat protein